MRTTWNRTLIAGALAATGLPALTNVPASAQGIAGGTTAPSAGGAAYSSPNVNSTTSPYIPVISPYGSAGVPGGGSSMGMGMPVGGTMAQGAASPYGSAANAGAASSGAANGAPRAPFGSAEYAPSGQRYAPPTQSSPIVPVDAGASSPYGSAASPYGAGAAGLGGRAVAPAAMASYPQGSAMPYGAGATGLGGRAVAPSSMMNSSQTAASPYGSAASPYSAGGLGGRTAAPSGMMNPNQGAPGAGRGVVLGGGGVQLGNTGTSDPSGMRASYANPGTAAPADRSVPAARGSAFAPDTMPYGPPPKPSRLRRFYNWLTGDDKSGDRPVRTYIDPSTGRTDLPMSKPWLKQVW